MINHFKLDTDFTVARINLLTGKYNQIRKQMELLGHPLINDFKYGYRGKNYNDSIGLRCVELSFTHPTTKEIMVFKAPQVYDDSDWRYYLNINNKN